MNIIEIVDDIVIDDIPPSLIESFNQIKCLYHYKVRNNTQTETKPITHACLNECCIEDSLLCPDCMSSTYHNQAKTHKHYAERHPLDPIQMYLSKIYKDINITNEQYDELKKNLYLLPQIIKADYNVYDVIEEKILKTKNNVMKLLDNYFKELISQLRIKLGENSFTAQKMYYLIQFETSKTNEERMKNYYKLKQVLSSQICFMEVYKKFDTAQMNEMIQEFESEVSEIIDDKFEILLSELLEPSNFDGKKKSKLRNGKATQKTQPNKKSASKKKQKFFFFIKKKTLPLEKSGKFFKILEERSQEEKELKNIMDSKLSKVIDLKLPEAADLIPNKATYVIKSKEDIEASNKPSECKPQTIQIEEPNNLALSIKANEIPVEEIPQSKTNPIESICIPGQPEQKLPVAELTPSNKSTTSCQDKFQAIEPQPPEKDVNASSNLEEEDQIVCSILNEMDNEEKKVEDNIPVCPKISIETNVALSESEHSLTYTKDIPATTTSAAATTTAITTIITADQISPILTSQKPKPSTEKPDIQHLEPPISKKLRLNTNKLFYMRMTSDRRSCHSNAESISLHSNKLFSFHNKPNKEYLSLCAVEDIISSTPSKGKSGQSLMFVATRDTIDAVEESVNEDNLMEIKENVATFPGYPLKQMIGFTRSGLSYLITIHENGWLILWKINVMLEIPNKIHALQHSSGIESVAIFDKYLIIGSNNGQLSLINLNNETMEFSDIKIPEPDGLGEEMMMGPVNNVSIIRGDFDVYRNTRKLRFVASGYPDCLVLYQIEFDDNLHEIKNITHIKTLSNLLFIDRIHGIKCICTSIKFKRLLIIGSGDILSFIDIETFELIKTYNTPAIIKEILIFDCMNKSNLIIFTEQQKMVHLTLRYTNDDANHSIIDIEKGEGGDNHEQDKGSYQNCNVIWDEYRPKCQLIQDYNHMNEAQLISLINNSDLCCYQISLT